MSSDTTTITVPTALVEAARSAMAGATARPWGLDPYNGTNVYTADEMTCVTTTRPYGVQELDEDAANARAIVCAIALADAILAAPTAPPAADLDAIEAAMAGRTEGEWDHGTWEEGEDYSSFVHAVSDYTTLVRPGVNNPNARADARAIVAAVNAVTALIAELRRLRALVARKGA